MKLRISAGGFGRTAHIDLDRIRHAESLGFDIAWSAEAYGNDAVTMATWVLANTTRLKAGTSIVQIPARTPAMTAMTTTTLDHLSGGRFVPGLGPSGPQVVEGWHGVPYGKPLTRTRETIAIIRRILAREAPLEVEGSCYRIPARGEGTTGLGKPLKSVLHGNPDIPIYTASISPNGLRCAGEVADGVFPMMMDPESFDSAYLPYLEEGFANAGGGKSLADFAVVPGVTVVISDDLEKARMPVKAAWPSTSAAWVRAGRTPTTTWRSAWATSREPAEGGPGAAGGGAAPGRSNLGWRWAGGGLAAEPTRWSGPPPRRRRRAGTRPRRR